MKHAPIFFLTDFGVADSFVGIMKAVALGMGFEGPMVDLAHGIPPSDILAAALNLEDAWPYLPNGSVVVAVVDPGVGTSRRPLVMKVGERYVVAPDNGIVTPLLRPEAELRQINKGGAIRPDRSATFHGRDVFTPAAALIAMNPRRFEEIGPVLANPTTLDMPTAQVTSTGTVILTVVAVDRYGNATLNHSLRDKTPIPLERGEFESSSGLLGPLRRTYADVPTGCPVVYWNSAGRLEVAVNGGHAARSLQLGVGATVHFKTMSKR